ncbi:MAG: hypothetical protein CM15mP109_10000 [Candidatus Dadabacteria bacterium]|nr:MAG: hypothetical protein CM15mP109_10000 [Candidatus Dadabacteria bacterium]
MKVNVVSLNSDKKSSQELSDEIYGLDLEVIFSTEL